MQRYLFHLAGLLFAPLVVLAQGDLNPPGGPSPGLKTLAQIEPRTDILKLVSSNDSFHVLIDSPGSYYLSGNLEVTRPGGIVVTAENVAIDLNGFGITRSSGTPGSAIRLTDRANNCTITNGVMKGFGYGVYAQLFTDGPGQPVRAARAGTLRDLTFENCSIAGAAVGGAWRVERCTASGGGIGFQTRESTMVRDCVAEENTEAGIIADAGSTVLNCIANRNGDGIRFLAAGQALGNFCELNTSAGIRMQSKARVQNNVCRQNSAGIVAGGIANVIDGNVIRDNTGAGIQVPTVNGKNVIIRNSAGDNGGSYSGIAAGNDVAPTGTAANVTSPYANLLN